MSPGGSKIRPAAPGTKIAIKKNFSHPKTLKLCFKNVNKD